jgi:hypothetical protein
MPRPYVAASIVYRCPDGPHVVATLPGPTASEALRKALNFDPHKHGVKGYFLRRCRRAEVELVQRGEASRTTKYDVDLGGARRRKRRRK